MGGRSTSNFIVKAAVIAALYAVLTLMLSPISYGPVQLRLSEALTVLALFTPAAVPGLAVGCFFANLLGPNGFADAMIGSFATLLGAGGMYLFRRKKFLSPMINVIVNGVVIGLMLRYIYKAPMSAGMCMLWVGLGEFVSCYSLGIPLIKLLEKRSGDIGL